MKIITQNLLWYGIYFVLIFSMLIKWILTNNFNVLEIISFACWTLFYPIIPILKIKCPHCQRRLPLVPKTVKVLSQCQYCNKKY